MATFLKWASMLAWGVFYLFLAYTTFDSTQSAGNRAAAAATFLAFQIQRESQAKLKEMERLSERIDAIHERLNQEPPSYFAGDD